MLAARTLGRVLALSRGAGQLVHGRAAAAAAAAGATSDAVGARRAAESLSTAELFRLLDACKVRWVPSPPGERALGEEPSEREPRKSRSVVAMSRGAKDVSCPARAEQDS